MVLGQGGGAGFGSNGGTIAPHMALGTFVDTSAPSARMIADVRAAEGVEGDLYDVHDAVLALPDFYADLRGDLDGTLWDRETAARAGARIVTPGDGTATLVFEGGAPVALYPITTSVVVILHARAGTRPVAEEPVLLGRRPVYGGKRKVVGHEEIWDPTPWEAARQRAEVAAWRAGLGVLVGRLTGLSGYVVCESLSPSSSRA